MRAPTKKKVIKSSTQVYEEYDQQVHPVGETFSDEQRLFRVTVIKTFLGAGVPLEKLNNFCELLKE